MTLSGTTLISLPLAADSSGERKEGGRKRKQPKNQVKVKKKIQKRARPTRAAAAGRPAQRNQAAQAKAYRG